MRQLLLRPIVYRYDNCKEFITDFDIGAGDLILTNKFIYKPYFGEMDIQADVLFQEQYGDGEPSDAMAEAIYADMKGKHYKRIIGIGGGTVIDLAKIFALKGVSPILDLFDRKLDIQKDKELILVPTTCGTGSEVTNISILELKTRHTKMGLADDNLYADAAVLIPQLLERLPYRFFAASSLDALVHAAESYVSPRATPYTRLFAKEAAGIILDGYRTIARDGEIARVPLLPSFLEASNYAGISFGNAGAGAVHALSYPLGGKYHVPHGEVNYAFFTKVFETYMTKRNNGAIAQLNSIFARAVGCDVKNVYPELERLLGVVMKRKPLREYGMTTEDIEEFTENVMTKQGRLMANNFVPLAEEDVRGIYQALY